MLHADGVSLCVNFYKSIRGSQSVSEFLTHSIIYGGAPDYLKTKITLLSRFGISHDKTLA
jgi:hypothetical protein